MSRGRAYRRWKAFNKCVYRIKKRLCWAGMSIECGERTFTDFKGNKHTQKVWREPTDWKEAKANNKWVGRLRKTTVRHSNPLDKVEDKQYNKKRRQESKDIIDEELPRRKRDPAEGRCHAARQGMGRV